MTTPTETIEVYHRDFLGQLLSVGNKVICITPSMGSNYRNFQIGVVESLTPKNVRVRLLSQAFSFRRQHFLQEPQRLIRIPDTERTIESDTNS